MPTLLKSNEEDNTKPPVEYIDVRLSYLEAALIAYLAGSVSGQSNLRDVFNELYNVLGEALLTNPRGNPLSSVHATHNCVNNAFETVRLKVGEDLDTQGLIDALNQMNA